MQLHFALDVLRQLRQPHRKVKYKDVFMKFVYVIFDKIMQEVSTIFIANNDNHAMMIFENSLRKAKDAGYQSEFDLKKVSEIKMDTGTCVSIVPPVVVNPTDVDTSDEQKELF